MEILFRRHSPQLSELFWEGMEQFLNARGHLLAGDLSATFLHDNADRYAQATYGVSRALQNCIGFFDGAAIAISRLGDNEEQNVVYNGHERRHALKYQAVRTPDGLIVHSHGPIEGRRHAWTIYMRSGFDESLPYLLLINGVQYVIYGDSGYNARDFIEVPFQGSNLCAAQKAFNTAMSRVRATVEWVFKEIYWTTVDFNRKMRISESPIGSLYLTVMLLTNMRYCVYPNMVSQYFSYLPPTIDRYLVNKD